MAKISYVNGQFIDHSQATINIDDRGILFSDGVYEVALIKKGVFIDWQEHCQRLQHSLDGIKINFKVVANDLEKTVRVLLEKNNMEDATLYLQITRGVAPRLHQFPNPKVSPSLVLTVSPIKHPSEKQYAEGVAAITTADLRWKRRDYKTISLLPNILAKQEAMEADAEESIMIEDDGYITEGSATNVFIINNNGQLQTHPLNERILGGITRAGILKVARENNVGTLEEVFTKKYLLSASEVFITSTTKHILPINKIDGNIIGSGKCGKITKKLIGLYQDHINTQVENN